MGTDRRQRVRPTHEWELLVPLFEWPEQKRYEEIRPLVLFDVSVAERAQEVGQEAWSGPQDVEIHSLSLRRRGHAELLREQVSATLVDA